MHTHTSPYDTKSFRSIKSNKIQREYITKSSSIYDTKTIERIQRDLFINTANKYHHMIQNRSECKHKIKQNTTEYTHKTRIPHSHSTCAPYLPRLTHPDKRATMLPCLPKLSMKIPEHKGDSGRRECLPRLRD